MLQQHQAMRRQGLHPQEQQQQQRQSQQQQQRQTTLPPAAAAAMRRSGGGAVRRRRQRLAVRRIDVDWRGPWGSWMGTVRQPCQGEDEGLTDQCD